MPRILTLEEAYSDTGAEIPPTAAQAAVDQRTTTRTLSLEDAYANENLQSAAPDSGEQGKRPDTRSGYQKIIDNIAESIVGNAEFPAGEVSALSSKELGTDELTHWKISTGFLLEPSIKGKADILKKFIPETRFQRDKNDNLYATLPSGKIAYLNDSGLSAQDALDVGAEIAKYLGPAGLASKATKGASLFTKVLAQSAAAGATSVVSDEAAQLAGSKVPTDLKKAGVIAGVAGAAEAISPAAGLVAGIFGKVLRGGKPSAQEYRAIESAGISQESLTPQNAAKLTKMIRGYSPEAQKRILEAQNLPVPIATTRGQATRNPADQLLEEQAQRKAFGEPVQAEALAKQATQNQAIEENIQALREQFSGASAGQSAVSIGSRVQNKVVQLKAANKAAVAEAYRVASEGNAAFPGTALQEAGDRFRRAFSELQLDVEGTPSVQRFMNRLDDLTEKYAGQNVKIKADVFQQMQKNINTNIVVKGGPGSLEARVGGRMKAEIRALENDYIEGGLLSGDPKVIQQFREATAKYADFKKNFEDFDTIAALTKKDGFGDAARLSTAPDDAINVIFGRGAVLKKGVGREVAQLKKLLPEADFGALKEAQLLRLTGENQGKNFSATIFKKNLQRALSEQPQAMKELYTSDEIAVLQRFSRVADNIQNPVKGGSNPSGTAAANAIFIGLRRSFGSTGDFLIGLVSAPIRGGVNAVQERNVLESLRGVPKSTQTPGKGTLPAAGAAAEDIRRKQQEQR